MSRLCFVLVMVSLALASAAATGQFALQVSPKATIEVTPPPVDPVRLRQGGDTVATAFTIPGLPFTDTGTTAGYTNDYDEVCPYTGSTSPDVVYSLVATTDVINIDLCGSSYDTKLYVYDSDLALIACNDDLYDGPPCGAYVSRLEGVILTAGQTYFVVIDGYGGAAGGYAVSVDGGDACALFIPDGAIPEGEPPLVPYYADCYNNGCEGTCMNGDPPFHWQALIGDPQGDLIFHGRSGWYTIQGGSHREVDWFTATLGPQGSMEIVADAVFPLYVFQMTTSCDGVTVVQSATAGPCTPVPMAITGAPGDVVWLLNVPATFAIPFGADPDGDGTAEFDYLIWVSGLAAGPVATESRAWGDVKALYE
jgi:hypothetical protein